VPALDQLHRTHPNGATGAKPSRGFRRRRIASGAAIGVLVGSLTAALVVEGDAQPEDLAESSISAPQPPTAEEPGLFRVECPLVKQAHVDPIVSPGRPSHHLHDLFGNASTTAESTYVEMLSGETDCTAAGDTAAYWSPALVTPQGTIVRPERAIFYYRNRPAGRGATMPFPRDFRMTAGGQDGFPNAYWTCDGEKDMALATRRDHIPDCGADGNVKMHVFFPSCWDGKRLDSADHRSHVAYGLDEDNRVDGTNPDKCPASHPVKIPQLDYRVLYPARGGAGYRLADGATIPHADFWNTWQQSHLDRWVQRCLWKGRSCGLASGTP
jgi:Domain of unknown function (DUF1996)